MLLRLTQFIGILQGYNGFNQVLSRLDSSVLVFKWILLVFTGYHEGFLDIMRFYWVLMGIFLMLVRFYGFWWAPLGLTRFY